VALHEVAHALGFTRGSLALFRDSDAGGAPRTARRDGAFTGPPDDAATGNSYGVSPRRVNVAVAFGFKFIGGLRSHEFIGVLVTLFPLPF
jgi:hypothetical protein